MKAFDYVRPATMREAVAAAAEPGAAYLAAGTNLLDLMKGGVSRPNRLVDVTRLPGLDRIEDLPDGGVRIGALVRNADLAHDLPISRAASGGRRGAAVRRLGAAAQRRDRRRQSAAADALRLFLRHRQRLQQTRARRGLRRPRGREPAPCRARLERGCIATHPSDFCVPLVALDAVVEIEGKNRTARGPARRASSAARRRTGARDRARARRADRRGAPAGRGGALSLPMRAI